MDIRPRRLKSYVDANDRAPFQYWLGKRKVDIRMRLRMRLNRVQAGNLGDCEPVGEGVYELKIDVGPGYRIYFGEDGDDVILLWGGDKSSQVADIRKAKTFWGDYNA